MKQPLVIGTRGSDLALWQAHFVQDLLAKSGIKSQLNVIKTKGDRIQNLSFDKIEGKGFFTKEIEESLLAESCDLAIHSFKDLETTNPEGLHIACMPQRANTADWLVIRKDKFDPTAKWGLHAKAVVGTSSARRKNQWKHFMPESEVKDLRGNVPTRLKKLEQGLYDGIILAAAGLQRLQLDLSAFEVVDMEAQGFVPAPAQGALGIQIRNTDVALKEALAPLIDQDNWECVQLERRVLKWVNGGCHVPLGVRCRFNDGKYTMELSYAKDSDGERFAQVLENTQKEQLIEQAQDFISQCQR